MKTNRFALRLAALAATALALTGCAKKAATPAPSVAIAPVAPSSPVSVSPALAPAAAADWSQVRGYSYDRRSELLASLPGMEARVDQQITELAAQRAALPNGTDTKDWDFQMKEMADARIYLKSADAELAKASPETWDQQREKVEQAWTRAQEAYRKVKASTTVH